MKKFKVIICDDNKEERERFISLCSDFSKRHEVVIGIKEYENGKTLLFDMEDTKLCAGVDILLLDINMPEINGIDVANKLRKYGFRGIIIFITVSKEHYESAFDVHAFNYITKRARVEERFEYVFSRAVKAAGELREEVIMFTAAGEIRQVPIKSIAYFEVDKYLVTVHYDDTTFEFISSLAKIEDQLFGRGFQRVHRAFLVAVSYIKGLQGNEIIMLDGTKISVSRKYLPELKKALAQRA